MFLIPTIICTIILFTLSYLIYKKVHIEYIIGFFISSLIISLICYGINISCQTTDREVWSGRITNVEHVEEYDEEVTETKTDSKGNTYTETHTEHHYAKNYIKTSDGGHISVNKSLDDINFNDSYPNTTEELLQYYPIGTPTASVHSYKNKVQSSYSIYKHKNIDLKQYKYLPTYPLQEYNYFKINRIIGDIPNKCNTLETLNEVNSDLNSKEKQKQVNIIFVNLGNVPEDYGFALQDYWKGGNKNDFIVCFSIDSNNNIIWCYPFSWADNQKSEELKINVRDYMLHQSNIQDFSPIIKDVGKMVEQDFERKQFADFNYLNVEVSTGYWVVVTILNIVGLITAFIIIEDNIK